MPRTDLLPCLLKPSLLPNKLGPRFKWTRQKISSWRLECDFSVLGRWNKSQDEWNNLRIRAGRRRMKQVKQRQRMMTETERQMKQIAYRSLTWQGVITNETKTWQGVMGLGKLYGLRGSTEVKKGYRIDIVKWMCATRDWVCVRTWENNLLMTSSVRLVNDTN